MTENNEEHVNINNHILETDVNYSKTTLKDSNHLNESDLEAKNIENGCHIETILVEEALQTESNDFSGSRSEVSTEKSDINSQSNISDEETDDPLPDNISLSLSMFQEENDKLKSTIENLELIISQQQKRINDTETKANNFEQKLHLSEKNRSELENRLHLVKIYLLF